MIDDFQRPAPKPRQSIDNVRAGSSDLEQSNIVRPTPQFGASSDDAGFRNPLAPELPAPQAEDGDEPELLLPAHADGGADKGGKPPKQPKAPGKTVLLFGKWRVSRKKLIIIIAVILLLASGAAAYALTRPDPAPAKKTTTAKKVVPPAPAPIVSPLTGLTVDSKEKTTWPVIGVMVENSPDARPQSGLKQAGVVYEAIAEAGITRFLALYQETRAENVGPVRSSRPYYLDWAMGFDASYAHVGGSPDALARIKAINVKDLDQFYNPVAYHRITARYAPHNVYTSVQQLVDLAGSKGWDTSKFTPFSRKADKPYVAPAAAPAAPATGATKSATKAAPGDSRTPATTVDFGISGAFYNAHYDYDAANNIYKRSEGGAVHMDADSNTQLTPKVVIALVMPYSLMSDGYHSQYNTSGTGKMYVFQDGTVTTGTWTKGEPTTQFDFKDDAGKTLSLDAGQTWISVVADAAKVTYK